ncbi:DUF721 domain-containing protein [Acidimangrovimonas sediminis]|uniref:DUF721 domain-containing protein n=1 Tax=Acidimangrovimonas sediminis TaxID=2056283 RepID=UPI001E3F5266|nr:DciA family protein [Acidimangrovimonas sediminis]
MPRPSNKPPARRMRGFEPASGLLKERIRKAGESRGFAVTRLLTHWAEIAGADIAACARPVKVTYPRDGFGATLTLLTTGARAPEVEMQKTRIVERVNACYGYAAISRVLITQTAPTGFSEGQVEFTPAPKAPPAAPPPEVRQRAAQASGEVQDPGLRAALEALGQNVLTRPRK